MVSTPVLPLLMPLNNFGPLGHALADSLDAPLRVMVESAYDRTTSPGVPTSWNVLYFPNPIKFATNLAVSIPTGFDNGIQDVFGVRPFRTTRPGPYGVGGPDVTYTSPDTTDSSSSAAATDTAVSAKESAAKDSAAKDSTTDSTETVSTVKKSIHGLTPHLSLAPTPTPTTPTKTAAKSGTKSDAKSSSSGESDSGSAKSSTPKSSKHSAAKRAKAGASS
jgi:hypothetical protein